MKAKLYRIYIEDVVDKSKGIESLVNSHLKSFTVFHAIGSHENKQEATLVIESICNEKQDEHRASIDLLTRRLKVFLSQKCVLVTEQEIEAEFV